MNNYSSPKQVMLKSAIEKGMGNGEWGIGTLAMMVVSAMFFSNN